MKKYTLNFLLMTYLPPLLLSACSGSHAIHAPFFNNEPKVSRESAETEQIENPEFWQESNEVIWNKLLQVPYTKLLASETTPDSYSQAWIRLASIAKSDSLDTPKLIEDLKAWRSTYPNHPGNNLFPDDNTLMSLSNQAPPKNIAVLLPLHGAFGSMGNTVRNGYLNAYFAEQSKTAYQQNIQFYDTDSHPNIQALYQEAISKGADFVIGPLIKDNVKKLTDTGSFSKPTLTLNYTDLWYGSLPANEYQFGLSPIDEAKQIADKAWQMGKSHALLIALQDDWGEHVTKALVSRWQADGGRIIDTYYVKPQSDFSKEIPQFLHIDIKKDQEASHDPKENNKEALEKQRRQDFDVVFLLVPPDKARNIVPLLRYYYVNSSVPIFSTSLIYEGKPNPEKDNDLNGVIFCDIPALLQSRLDGENPRLFAVGQDAYRISHDLDRFLYLPNFPAYGGTGALSLDPNHQFYRRLAWAEFHEGQP